MISRTAIIAFAVLLGLVHSQPYGSCVLVVPGTIEAENFDLGGEGVGYHDTEPANLGGQYRLTEGVDIGLCLDDGGGYSVGWAFAGEWLNYTIYVPATNTYQFSVRVASQGAGGVFHFEVNGQMVGTPMQVPDTGSWQTWASVASNLDLPAGAVTLRLVFDSNGVSGAVGNFNSFVVPAPGQSNLQGDTASPAPATPNPSGFQLANDYSSNQFFAGYDFFTAPDPTHGFVEFLDYNTASSLGLARLTPDGKVFMGADNTTVSSGAGRRSLRLTSKAAFNGGLFLIDLEHMPTGCGTWPAYWLVGPNWPSGGEIDIIEGVDRQGTVLSTLHTDNGCSVFNEPTTDYTGTSVTKNCYISAPGQGGNQGCSIWGPANSMGAPFNAQQGGVYATLWDGTGIRHWFWPRSAIPTDVSSGAPNPDSWGKPYAMWALGPECPTSHFTNNNIVFDLTFCGDWAGNVFGSDCPGLGSCNAYVQNTPSAFTESYWLVNYVRVFQKQ